MTDYYFPESGVGSKRVLVLRYSCYKPDCDGEIVVEWNLDNLMSPEVLVYCPKCDGMQIARVAGVSYAVLLKEVKE